MQDFITLCQNRRSIRKYQDRPIEQEHLDYILQCALMSPAGKRCNEWEFYVVTDVNKLRTLKGCRTYGSGMFETAMVAVLVSALCELIRENGGFEALLAFVRRVFRGKRAGQLGIGLLVGAMDIATANNTVAIVMANPIAAQIADEYGITNKKTASILDTFSCIFQGFLPYGAQLLVAVSAVATMGESISAFAIIGNLFYPMMLLLSSLTFIFLIPERKEKA